MVQLKESTMTSIEFNNACPIETTSCNEAQLSLVEMMLIDACLPLTTLLIASSDKNWRLSWTKQ